MIFFTAFESVSVLFALILVGFVVGKTGLVSERGQADLTKLVIYVTLPATIINSMVRPLNSEDVYKLLQIIGITFISYVFIIGISYLITSKYKLPKNQRDILFVGASFSNISFMGFPVLASLYGADIIFFASITQSIFFQVYAWLICLPILESTSKKEKTGFSIKSIFLKPGIVAVMIGLIIFISQVHPPSFVLKTLATASGATSPLAMITVGLMLSRSDLKKAISNKYLYYTSAIKLILIPCSVIFVFSSLGIRDIVLNIPAIELGMPTAALLAMLSGYAENDTSLASQQVFISSLFSIITIPVIVTILESIV